MSNNLFSKLIAIYLVVLYHCCDTAMLLACYCWPLNISKSISMTLGDRVPYIIQYNKLSTFFISWQFWIFRRHFELSTLHSFCKTCNENVTKMLTGNTIKKKLLIRVQSLNIKDNNLLFIVYFIFIFYDYTLFI